MRRGPWLPLLLATFLLLAAAVPAGAEASPSVKLTPDEQQWLNSHPGLRIGIRETPPLVMRGENGSGYQGLSIDYVNKVEKLLGIRFNLIYYPSWQKLLEETKNRNVDIIVTGTITLDRSIFLDFTPPYIQLHNKIIVRKELDNVQHELAEMAGLKVAAVEGTAVYNFIAQKYPEIKLVPARDEVAALEAVSFGETYAAVMEMARATYYIDQEKIANLTIAGDAGYLYNFCFSSRNDWSELNSILTKALAVITQKERREITRKWLGSDDKSLFLSRSFWISAGVSAGVFAVMLIIIWNIALRRKVARSTREITQEMERLELAENELRRLNRTLLVLGKSHEILMQFTEEISLYNAICKHIVEVGGFPSAWVVLCSEESWEVVAGYCHYDASAVGIEADLCGQPHIEVVKRAIKAESAMINIESAGLESGGAEKVTSIAIPIWGEGRIIGAVEIESVDKGTFDEQEISLLTELMENLAYSVASIRLKEEHRESEELVRKLSQAVEQSPVTILITDSAGNMEYVNPCFTKTTGYTFEEAIGQNPRILKSGLHPPEYYKTLWDIISGGFEWHGEFCDKKKNGELIWESASISPVRNADGEITNYIAVKEDITDQKRVYDELQRAKLEAETATTAKSAFLANMSHEIRTPMNAVIGMLYLVQQSELSEKQKSYILKAEGAAKSLLKIINDILDFSKIEAGRLQMESIPFLLSEVLTKVTDIAPVNVGTKKIDLTISLSAEVPDFLNGDPLRLGQILLNLVSNAIKFTEQGDILISVDVESKVKDNVCLKFAIEDSGIGMTPEQKDRLFGAFSQADTSTTRRFGGTGLGLTISKQLVELMGGEISVESEAGVGSVFTFLVNFHLEEGHDELLADTFKLLSGLRILHVCGMGKGSLATAKMLGSFGIVLDSMLPEEAAGMGEAGYDLILYDVSINDAADVGEFFRSSCIKPLAGVPALLFTNDRKLTGIESSCSPVVSIVVKPSVPTNLLYALLEAVGAGAKQENAKDSFIAVENYFKGRRLLLAEDNPINQEVAKEIVEGWGIALDIAANGAIAVQMIYSASSPYDAVLMDLQMPVMDGFEATKLIRASDKYRDLPIIAITASATTSDRDLCIVSGMNDHVAKPIDVAELFSTLHRWFRPDSEVPKQVVDNAVRFERVQIPFPGGTPGIDLDKALRRLGNQQILITILKEFRRLHTEDDRAIREAVDNGALLIAKRAAHTLKGLARTIGAEETGEAAARIEDALSKENLADVGPLVEALSDKLTILRRSLDFLDELPRDEFLQVGGEPREEAADPGIIADLLKEMSQQLLNNDLEACTTFRKLKHLLVSAALHGHLKQLEAGVDSLNFKEAKAVLDGIAEILNIGL